MRPYRIRSRYDHRTRLAPPSPAYKKANKMKKKKKPKRDWKKSKQEEERLGFYVVVVSDRTVLLLISAPMAKTKAKIWRKETMATTNIEIAISSTTLTLTLSLCGLEDGKGALREICLFSAFVCCYFFFLSLLLFLFQHFQTRKGYWVLFLFGKERHFMRFSDFIHA